MNVTLFVLQWSVQETEIKNCYILISVAFISLRLHLLLGWVFDYFYVYFFFPDSSAASCTNHCKNDRYSLDQNLMTSIQIWKVLVIKTDAPQTVQIAKPKVVELTLDWSAFGFIYKRQSVVLFPSRTPAFSQRFPPFLINLRTSTSLLSMCCV